MLLNKRIYACVIVALLCALECRAGCREKFDVSQVEYVSPDFVPRTKGTFISPKIQKLDPFFYRVKEAYKIIINNNKNQGTIGPNTSYDLIALLHFNDRHTCIRSWASHSISFDEHRLDSTSFHEARNAKIFTAMRVMFWSLNHVSITKSRTAALEYTIPETYSFKTFNDLETLDPQVILNMCETETQPKAVAGYYPDVNSLCVPIFYVPPLPVIWSMRQRINMKRYG